MTDWQQEYNRLLTEKLKSIPYKGEIGFIHQFMPSIPVGQLFVQPAELIEFNEKKYNFYIVGNVFNAVINLEPRQIHEDYLKALEILELIVSLSTEWEKTVAPIREETYQKVMRDQALENKKIIQPQKGLVIPGNFKR